MLSFPFYFISTTFKLAMPMNYYQPPYTSTIHHQLCYATKELSCIKRLGNWFSLSSWSNKIEFTLLKNISLLYRKINIPSILKTQQFIFIRFCVAKFCTKHVYLGDRIGGGIIGRRIPFRDKLDKSLSNDYEIIELRRSSWIILIYSINTKRFKLFEWFSLLIWMIKHFIMSRYSLFQ